MRLLPALTISEAELLQGIDLLAGAIRANGRERA